VGEASTERETLERLRGDEADLERVVRSARDEAAAIVEAARREAERIASEARRDAEREVERVRAASAEEIDRGLGGAQAAVVSEAAALRARAGQNRERAVARAIAAALGGKG
jgi:F0F1-type ATP synthase membrane subunit b/b'